MKVFSSISDLDEKKDVAITMGNFDGVHLGHRELIKNAIKESKERGLAFGVITFTPHPLEFFKGVTNFYINTLEERRELIRSLGVDFLIELPFNESFSKQDPEEFLNNYILKIKGLKKIFLGHDFAFGKGKKGDLGFVREFIKSTHLELMIEEEFLFEGKEVCSSKIRSLINEGNLYLANLLLNRNFFISGSVVKGEGRGKGIGIPTINLKVSSKGLIPPFGVYVTRTEIFSEQYLSLTNIGLNPTFLNDNKVKVETHILDFDENCYEEKVRVNFIEKIRDEKKFSSPDELVEQIKSDIDYTRVNFN